jgi:hypothetical protein
MIPELLLFLDFDGVLHPAGCDPSEHFCNLPELESLLREHPAVQIVISSTWQEAYSVRALRDRFSPDIAARIIGAIRVADPEGEAECRYEAIDMFLRHIGRLRTPWIALDDAEHEFPIGCAQLVLCDSARGFDSEAKQRLDAKLRQCIARGLSR